jgi:hypothetical protein
MLRIVIATTVVAFCATGAEAYCLSAPDNATSNYIENSTAHTLCLQQELSDSTERVELETRFKAQIELLTQQQQKLQMQSFEPFAAPRF